MKLSNNALKILESRYLLKDVNGITTETPSQLFRRVAKHIAGAEIQYGKGSEIIIWENKFHKMMEELKFLPNSPTLMNAGTSSGQLSACFVLPVEDSLIDIFTTLKNAALIHQSGGGTGFNFSSLRPKGDYISPNSGGSSGPISFMKIFDAATKNIKQGGKRRGANMAILNIDHPDIEEFINAKNNNNELQNFNISIGISDYFMKAVLNNDEFELKHPSSRKVLKKIKALTLWDMIIHNAWNNGDPGLIFIDSINRSNPTPSIGEINCTNPCGEVPLLEYEACNLGSIDISRFANPNSKEIYWDDLRQTVILAIRFLDNVIEINDYILPEIKNMVNGNRKVGLGIMGWANLLILLEIPYASNDALTLAEKLMAFINETSLNASQILAEERGVFKNWEKSIYFPEKPVRNSTRTSIAPTGTISIIANTSSSIEPLFALAIRRENVLNNETLIELNPQFVNYMKSKNLYSEDLIEHVKKTGTVTDFNLPINIKNLFKTSLDIEYEWHLKHQVVFQKHTDNAVSKTINLPEDASINNINDAFMHAWKQDAKGITVFRYNSKQTQVLHSGIQTEQSSCKICRE